MRENEFNFEQDFEKTKETPIIGYNEYFKKINKIPLLTEEETLLLLDKIKIAKKTKDKTELSENTEKLVLANLRLVVFIAQRYIRKNPNLELSDLIQEGNIGLIKATKTFDAQKNCKFSIYAGASIEQEIIRALYNKERIIRIPVTMIEQINKYHQVIKKLTQKLEKSPSTQEIAKEMGDSPKKVLEITRTIKTQPISLQTIVKNDKDTQGTLLQDFIPDKRINFDEEIIKKMLKEQFINIIKNLKIGKNKFKKKKLQKKHEKLEERDKKIFIKLLSLNDGIIKTLEEVGKEFNLSRQRIEQIKEKILKKIKENPEYQKIFQEYFETL
ncbi:MAG: RNA polymerase sigma factor RpoD/SigA [Candidatus Kuenenbacteria bacterium]